MTTQEQMRASIERRKNAKIRQIDVDTRTKMKADVNRHNARMTVIKQISEAASRCDVDAIMELTKKLHDMK